MITCKEDMRGCYAPRCDKEVFELFMDKCEEFCVGWSNAKPRDYIWGEAVVFSGTEEDKLTHGSEPGMKQKGYKRLTLSDLKPTKQYAVLHKGGSYSFQSDKPIGDDVVACFDLANSEKPLSEDFFDEKPRTKVEYEKVTESIFDLKDEFYSGKLSSLNSYDNYMSIDTLSELVDSVNSGNIYRKVERSVEWWEDAMEFIVENDDDDLSAYFDKQSGYLRVNTNLPRDKWCDFARILLEQEGE